MIKFCLVFTILPIFVYSGAIYIEHHELEFDKKYCVLNVSYLHDEGQNAVVNLTIQTFVTLSKILLYFEIRGAEEKNDNEYKRQLIKTVINADKFWKGMQSKPLLRGYAEVMRRYMDFNVTIPFIPVRFCISLQITNVVSYVFSTGDLQVYQLYHGRQIRSLVSRSQRFF